MAETYKRKYGLDWPLSFHDIFIDMSISKKWNEFPYNQGNLDDPGTHLLRACRELLTPKEFTISPWSEQHAEDWCETDFCITWGGAACSKSNDYGLYAVIDWATDPTETITLMASTTREMLKLRSYESVVRYFQLLKRNPYFLFPGKESKTTTAIINVDEADGPLSTIKASIRGAAVNEGGSLQGAHLPYVRLILDELSEMKEHGMNARANLSAGCRNFKVFGLCNPTTFYDQGSMFAVPKDGWSSVNAETELWPTRWGRVRHHNGFHSPAIEHPDRYPFMINQEQIDQRLREEDGNIDARDVWVFIRGFPPRSGVDDTVLTPELVQTHKLQTAPVWLSEKHDLMYVAGLDPAFTSGGDDCVLKIGCVGVIDDKNTALAFVDTVKIPIDVTSSRPATYQVVDAVRVILDRYGIPVARLCIDDSGTQSVADVVEVEIGAGVIRVNNSMSATDRHISAKDPTPMKDKFVDRGTEAWMHIAALGKRNMIRGMTDRAANEFCIRRLVPSGRRKRLESKVDFKKRLKGYRSPDDGDATALCAEAAIRACGLLGASQAPFAAHGPSPFRKAPGRQIIVTMKPSNYVDNKTWNRLSSYIRPYVHGPVRKRW